MKNNKKRIRIVSTLLAILISFIALALFCTAAEIFKALAGFRLPIIEAVIACTILGTAYKKSKDSLLFHYSYYNITTEYCKKMRDVPEEDKCIIQKAKEELREKYSNIDPKAIDECENFIGQAETLTFVLKSRAELFHLTRAEISSLIKDYGKPLYFEYQVKAAPTEILSKCRKYTEERKTDKLKKFLSKNEQLDAKCKAILINYYCENASGVLTPSENSSKNVPDKNLEINDKSVLDTVSEISDEEKAIIDFTKSNITCHSCGAALLENATFCNKCGAKYFNENEKKSEITTNDERPFCRKCGEKLFSDSDFCHKCGTKIIK